MDPNTEGNPTDAGAKGSETLDLHGAFSGVTGNETSNEPEKGTGEGLENQLPAWTAQLPSDIRGNSELMGKLGRFSKIGDLVNSYNELESKLGSSFSKPKDDATIEEINAFYEKLGRPKTADEYSFAKDDAFQLKQIAFDLGLSEAQAKGIYDKLQERGTTFVQNLKDASQKQFEETDAALRKQYGNKYSEKMQLLQRGLNAFGGNDLGNVLNNAGVLYNKQVCDLFIKLGEMTAENTSNMKGETVGDTYKSVYNGGTMTFKGLN